MKILLACSLGMSTSLLEKSINDYILKNNLKVEALAKSIDTAINELDKWDIILLGPQVRYQLDNFKIKTKTPVETINPTHYAMSDGEAVYGIVNNFV